MFERNYLAVYVHLVWGTWDRLPLLTGDLERDMHRAIGAECIALSCESIALGGVADHVHLLVRLAATLSIADLMKQLKGSSAHLFAHQLVPGAFFKWQAGYGAVSVSPRHLDQVSNYIAKQREHHASTTLLPSLELKPRSNAAQQ